MKQVCVQLPASADNVALLAFDAARRAAIDRYLLLAGPTAANPPSGGGRMMACTDRQTDGCPTTGWRRGVEVAEFVNERS